MTGYDPDNPNLCLGHGHVFPRPDVVYWCAFGVACGAGRSWGWCLVITFLALFLATAAVSFVVDFGLAAARDTEWETRR